MTYSVPKIALLLAAAALVGGCNPFKKEKPVTPTIGERISVLTGETEIEVDPATAALPSPIPGRSLTSSTNMAPRPSPSRST